MDKNCKTKNNISYDKETHTKSNLIHINDPPQKRSKLKKREN